MVCLSNAVLYEYKNYKFEFDPRWGPVLIDDKGNIIDQMMEEQNPFWSVFEEWFKLSDLQKKKTELIWEDFYDEDGYNEGKLVKLNA